MKPKYSNPKVSIVIPVYNGSNFLSEAIESALAQSYRNIEVIVVNDGSTDGGATEKIARSYGDRIRYFHKGNGGVSSALNFGVKKMTGSYFSWLSHDDLYEKTKIEDQVDLIKSLRADKNIAVCNVRAMFESGIKKQGLIDKKTFMFFEIFLAISADIGLNGCTLLIPKKALVESGGFDVNLPVTQDYDLWYRLSHKYEYKFVLLEKNLVLYRRHDEQDSVKKQQLLLEAADDLHYEILNNIDYRQFEEYFRTDKANVRYTWDNYSLYKARGYKRTASMILKNMLRYCYENDRDKFYKVFSSEIETGVGAKDRQEIVQEYDKLLKSGTNNYPIKEDLAAHESRPPKTRIHRVARRFGESLSRDGVYLTGEKVVRRVYKKARKGRRQR